MSQTDHALWIVDEIVARPGRGEAFLAAYLEDYAPKVRANGLTLAHCMVEPAMWLDDAPNHILCIWTAADAVTVWTAKHRARGDADIARWWNETAPPFLESRRRGTFADADALADLDHV